MKGPRGPSHCQLPSWKVVILRLQCSFLFLSFFLAAPQRMEFLGQGSDSGCRCELRSSCSNTRFFSPMYQGRQGLNLCPVAAKTLSHSGNSCDGFLPSILFFFFILGRHLPHMEVPRLGVKSELQLPAYTTSHSNTGSSSPRSRARDRTCILMDTFQIHYH